MALLDPHPQRSKAESARTVDDVDCPGYGVHPLKGDLAGLWSVTINDNWRIVSRCADGMAFDVELIDGH